MSKKKLITVITGANGGIGVEILKKLSISNHTIYALVRKKNIEFTQTCSSFSKKYKNKIKIIECDFLDKKKVKEAIKVIRKEKNNIDNLIHTAGTIQSNLFQFTETDDLKKLYEVNLFSPFEITKEISKQMMDKKRKSNIIFVSSTASTDPSIGRFAYASSKSALDITAKTLSLELARYNILVNVVSPGLTKTKMMEENTSKKYVEDYLNHVALKRPANPKEIADVVLFLISDKNSYITGQIIRSDGGKF